MTRPNFIFLGVTESGTNANIGLLQGRLEKLPAEYNRSIKIEPKGDLLILTLPNPGFCYYVALVKNNSGEFSDWTELAKNFNLPWDRKPVTATRLQNIYEFLEKQGKSEYNTYHEIGLAILNELEKFSHLKVFTIPSFEKKGFWNNLFTV